MRMIHIAMIIAFTVDVPEESGFDLRFDVDQKWMLDSRNLDNDNNYH